MANSIKKKTKTKQQNSRDRRDKVQTKARSGYLGNALFQDLLVDVKETGSEVVLFDSAREGKTIFQATQDPAGNESHPYPTTSGYFLSLEYPFQPSRK